MENSWKIPKLKVVGDVQSWYINNQLFISEIFLLFSENIILNNMKCPADVIELIHTNQCDYSVVVTIHNKENLTDVLKKCLDVFVDYEEYELAQRANYLMKNFF